MQLGNHTFKFKHEKASFFQQEKISHFTYCKMDDNLLEKTSCSVKDNFCKATGRKIALKRAIELLPKKERTLIWNDYFKITR